MEAAADVAGAESTTYTDNRVAGFEAFTDILKGALGEYCKVGHSGIPPLHSHGIILGPSAAER